MVTCQCQCFEYLFFQNIDTETDFHHKQHINMKFWCIMCGVMGQGKYDVYSTCAGPATHINTNIRMSDSTLITVNIEVTVKFRHGFEFAETAQFLFMFPVETLIRGVDRRVVAVSDTRCGELLRRKIVKTQHFRLL